MVLARRGDHASTTRWRGSSSAAWPFSPGRMAGGGTGLDLGGGTAANLEYLGDRLAELGRVFVVDLSPSLLTVAEKRVAKRGWTNVELVRGDATKVEPPGGAVDVVSCSYSLTMMPDWFAAIDRAYELLRPGGMIGVVDFFVSRRHAGPPHVQHGWWTRHFWPAWFARDNVHLSADHLPYLERRFETLSLAEERSPVPYLPGLTVPYYRFVGRKPLS